MITWLIVEHQNNRCLHDKLWTRCFWEQKTRPSSSVRVVLHTFHSVAHSNDLFASFRINKKWPCNPYPHIISLSFQKPSRSLFRMQTLAAHASTYNDRTEGRFNRTISFRMQPPHGIHRLNTSIRISLVATVNAVARAHRIVLWTSTGNIIQFASLASVFYSNINYLLFFIVFICEFLKFEKYIRKSLNWRLVKFIYQCYLSLNQWIIRLLSRVFFLSKNPNCRIAIQSVLIFAINKKFVKIFVYDTLRSTAAAAAALDQRAIIGSETTCAKR